jgi:RNA polymerase sigma-70 factor (ECF subfamily)
MTSPEDSPEGSDLACSVAAALARVREGETEAFAIVVKAYQRRLLSLCVAMLGELGAAEEVTQDAFTRAFRYLESFDIRRPFYPWLAKIAVRLVQQYKVQRQLSELPLTAEIDRAGSKEHPLAGMIRDERAHALWAAVLRLPERERAAVVLHFRQELTVQETASALGVTAGTVKTLLFRSRRHLRERLTGTQEKKS